MQGQNHACYLACDGLSHEAVEVAARQDAYHQAVAVDDDHQPCHCLVAEVVSVCREHYLVAVVACGHPTHLAKDGVAYQAAKSP